jgi:hypothetical protein
MPPATISPRYSVKTGDSATGCSGGGLCAEDRVVGQLGGDPADVRFTEAIRPRTDEEVGICTRCQGNSDQISFRQELHTNPVARGRPYLDDIRD